MAKKSSKSSQANYSRYESEARGNKNKQRKLEKHLKAHPEDAQAALAAKAGVTITGAKKRLGKAATAKERDTQKAEKISKRSEKLLSFGKGKGKKGKKHAKEV